MTYQLTADEYELLSNLFYPENEPPRTEVKVEYDSEVLPLCYKLVNNGVITITVAAHQDFVVVGKIQNGADNPVSGSYWGTNDYMNMFEEFVLNADREPDIDWWE